jgi:ribosomal protein L22
MSTSKLIAQLVDEEEQEKINSIIDSSGNSVVESWTNNNNAGRNVDEGDNDDFSIHSTQLPMQVASAATPTEPAPVLQPLMQPPNQVRKQSSAQSLSPQSAAQSPMQFRRRDSVISSTLLSLLDDVNVGNASNIIASTDLTVDNVNAITSMQTASSPDQIKAQKLSELIQLGRLCANKALQLHHAIHSKKDIHGSIYASTATAAQPLLHAADAQGDDAISLVPLLELTSEMYERSQYVQQSQSAQAIGANIDTNDALHDAIDLLEYAEVVCTRILGFYHAETVRIMLTIVKLLLKCGNGDAYRAAAIKATDMSRRLDQLALTDPQRADVLGRKCAEVIALSKLLEQYSADDDAGNGEDEEEEGDEHTDGDTNSTSITSSLFGNSQGGDPSKKARSESAAAFISNIKNISTTFAASRSHYANDIRNAMVKEIRAEKRRQRRIQKTLRAKEAKEREQQLQQQQLQQRSNSVMISRSASVFSVGSRANNNNSGEKMTKESLAESVSIILNKQKQNAASTEDSSSTGGPQNTMDKIKEYQKEVEELQVNIR